MTPCIWLCHNPENSSKVVGGDIISCSNPCRTFYCGKRPDGKMRMCFCKGHDVDHIEEQVTDEGVKLVRVRSPDYAYGVKVYTEYDEVPCGKCLGCHLDRAREWSDRCLMEMDAHPDVPAYFLTLTYSNQFLPLVKSKASDQLVASLRYRDIQLFLKRLRKYYPDEDIRFLCCGEYGPETLRPHYHMILIGHEFEDLIPYKHDDRGYNLYLCPELDKLWKLGFCVVGNAGKDSAGYVARYNMKALQNEALKDLVTATGIEAPRLRGSRRPALGRDFILFHKDEFLQNGSVWIKTPTGGKRVNLPRYGQKLLEDDPYYAVYKANCRQRLEFKKISIDNSTDLDWYDYLKLQGDSLELRTKSLERKSV